MKRLLNLTGFLILALAGKTQDIRTISLASENNLPFYAKISGRTLNSTSAGFLTISGLRDSTYEIAIGFPDNRYPEQLFRVGVNKYDIDFNLKNLGEPGWALQDIKTQNLISSSKNRAVSSQNGGDVQQVKRTDAFAIMMAAVVNDTSVLYTSVSRAEPVSEIKKPVVIDSSKTIVTKNESPKQTEKTSPPIVPVSDTKNNDQLNKSVATQKALDSANDKKAADKLAADKLAADKLAADKLAANKLAADKATDDRAAADKLIADKLAADKLAADKLLADKLAADKLAADKVAADKAAADKLVADQIAADKLANDKLAADKLAADKLAADKVAADKAAADKAAADKLAADKLAAEKNKTAAVDSAIAKNTITKKTAETPPVVKAKIPDTTTERKKQEGLQLDNKTRIFKLGIVKVAEQKQEKGLHMIFIDRSGPDHADTIQVMIPVETTVPASTQPASKTEGSSLKTNNAAETIIKTDTVKKEYAPQGPVWRPIEKTTTSMVNSDCKNFATEYDLDKLRVRMIADNNADDRINTARKVFRTKCFTTRQVRALSELFINDEGKYKFLDASYPYVSDSGSFKSLADLLKDQYYINRFNAMLRN